MIKLDEEKIKAFHRAISRTVYPGDIVLDCNVGCGILSSFAAKEGATVTGFDRNPDIQKNEFSEKIKVIKGDAASFKENVNVVILNATISEQIKISNALVSKNIINCRTKVIPLMCSNFFEAVNYNFCFYNLNLPMVIQGSNERCMDVLSCATLYSQLKFKELNNPKLKFETNCIMQKSGYLNALKFTSVFSYLDDILLGTEPIFVPTKEIFVKEGEIVKIKIDGNLGRTIKVDFLN